MNSNKCSDGIRNRPPGDPPDGLAALTADVDGLAAQDLDGLSDAALAEYALQLRRLLDRLEGHWLGGLALLDARGAAGADHGTPAPSTAGWLRNRLRMGAGAASSAVTTARALFRGPLTRTAQALTSGELSAAHAAVLAHGTHDLPSGMAAEAEPVLVEAARRLDPPRLRRVLGHLRQVADPDGADRHAERRHQRHGLWLAPTWEGMVALQGLLEAEAGHILLAALEPLARPASADDPRSGDQRRADALTELARRNLEGGQLPQAGGARPQLAVMVDLDSLLGRPGAVGGEAGGAGPLAPEACRRLACDGAVTRVLVRRHPPSHHGGELEGHHLNGAGADRRPLGPHPNGRYPDDHQPLAGNPSIAAELGERLRAARTRLPPILGGAASQPLDLGRATRVVSPAQRTALAVRDGGCVFPDCGRPLSWCEAHHLIHWADGGPTDLANLALVCRAHHRTVHEGGWRLTRDPDGRLTAHPPHRRPPAPQPPHRRQPALV
jgi:Domain of unknown function (DUF222)/HNH endonuclease